MCLLSTSPNLHTYTPQKVSSIRAGALPARFNSTWRTVSISRANYVNILLYCHMLIKAISERLSNKDIDTTDIKTCYYYTERDRIMGIVSLLVNILWYDKFSLPACTHIINISLTKISCTSESECWAYK